MRSLWQLRSAKAGGSGGASVPSATSRHRPRPRRLRRRLIYGHILNAPLSRALRLGNAAAALYLSREADRFPALGDVLALLVGPSEQAAGHGSGS